MPVKGKKYTFTKKNVDNAPAVAGVYALFVKDGLIYYGRARGTSETIRSRLQSHHAGREGACTKAATHYKREATSRPVAREKELLDAFKKRWGKLPRCNEQSP